MKKRLNLSKKQLKNLYINKKISSLKIAKMFDCSISSVRNYLIKYDIKLRTLKDAHANVRGRKNGNYKDGRMARKVYCQECGKKLSMWYVKLCRSCSTKYRWTNKKYKDKMKNRTTGNKNGNYIDGRSKKPYTLEFNEELKEQIRKRDNYTCQKCNITEEEHLIVYGIVLSVHHIDYNKENCKKENLITLCNECNSRVNFNRNYWTKFFKDRIHLSIFIGGKYGKFRNKN